MNKLFIFTLNWNGRDKLEKLYPSLVDSLQNINYEWLIKENDSKDGSKALIRGWDNLNVRLIHHPHNRDNFSQGCNLLFKLSEAQDEDFILLLNNDVIFNDTTSISKMTSIMENDPEVGVVGARLLYTETNKLQHAGVVFNPTYKTPMHFRAGEMSDANAEKNRLFQAVTGAVMLTKAKYYRNVFKNKTGEEGADNSYFWAFDDVDLCLSIHYNMNKKIVYCGETNIYHEESATLKKNPINKLFLPHNLRYLFEKWQYKYTIDQDIYTKDPQHNLYLGK